jgi:hypothetical protein
VGVEIPDAHLGGGGWRNIQVRAGRAINIQHPIFRLFGRIPHARRSSDDAVSAALSAFSSASRLLR